MTPTPFLTPPPLCSVIGVVVVSKSDHDLPSLPSDGGSSDPTLPTAPLLGDALALASALAYAFYVILLKVRIKNEARVSMTLFFGFVRLDLSPREGVAVADR